MDDAHIPNSHPDVTPNWRPYKFDRIPLNEALKTTRVHDAQSPRYAGVVPPSWCGRSGRHVAAHGGFVASAFISAALQYSRDTNAGESLFHPLSLSVEYLQPLPEGPFEISIHDYAVQGNITTLRAEVTSMPEQVSRHDVSSIAMIRLRRNGTGQGIGQGSKAIAAQLPPLPDRVNDCARWGDAALYYFNPPTSYIRMYAAKGQGFPLWSEKYGRNQRWQWAKLDRDEKFGLLDLPVLSDLVPSLTLNYEDDGMAAISRFQIATLSLRIDFRSSVLDEEWLASKIVMHKLHDGLFDLGIQIFNDQGDIVATSTQMWSLRPRPGQTKL